MEEQKTIKIWFKRINPPAVVCEANQDTQIDEVFSASDIDVSEYQTSLFFGGMLLSDRTKSLKHYGIGDGDEILVICVSLLTLCRITIMMRIRNLKFQDNSPKKAHMLMMQPNQVTFHFNAYRSSISSS